MTLPLRATRKAGMALLMGHADWVANRLAALPDAVKFVDGAVVPIAGEPYRIRHAPASRGGAFLLDQELHVPARPSSWRDGCATSCARKLAGA